MENMWDCIIVGGGAAGLSAALVLGRARKRTLLVDAGQQSNLAAHGIGGLLGHDGRSPAELYEIGRRELAAYPSVELRTGEVTTGERTDGGFAVRLADGTRERTRRVLLATGMEYRPPELPGLEQLWGGSAFHCPFCHGWEMRDQPLAVLARGPRAVHSALLLHGWSDDIVVLTDGPDELEDDDRARLADANITIDARSVAELESTDGELRAVVFDDGTRLGRKGVLVATTLRQRSTLAEQLGAESADPTPVAENPIAVDGFYRTTAAGVFAAGDLSVQMPQVAAAIASGSHAGAAVVQSLMADEYGLAVPEGRQRVNA